MSAVPRAVGRAAQERLCALTFGLTQRAGLAQVVGLRARTDRGHDARWPRSVLRRMRVAVSCFRQPCAGVAVR